LWSADFESTPVGSSVEEEGLFKIRGMSPEVPAEMVVRESSDGDFSTGKVLELKRTGEVAANANGNVQVTKIDPSLSLTPDQLAILKFEAKRSGPPANLAIDFASNKGTRVGREPLTWLAAENGKFACLTAIANRTSAPVALPGGLPPAKPNQAVLFMESAGGFSEIGRKSAFDESGENICGFLITTTLPNGEITWTFDNFVFTDDKATLGAAK
jgi:hypothetical protein